MFGFFLCLFVFNKSKFFLLEAVSFLEVGSCGATKCFYHSVTLKSLLFFLFI